MTNSVLMNSTPEGAYHKAIEHEHKDVVDDSPILKPKRLDMHKVMNDSEPSQKGRSRNKNMMRLKTKPLESSFKIENKRKRKEKRNKSIIPKVTEVEVSTATARFNLFHRRISMTLESRLPSMRNPRTSR